MLHTIGSQQPKVTKLLELPLKRLKRWKVDVEPWHRNASQQISGCLEPWVILFKALRSGAVMNDGLVMLCMLLEKKDTSYALIL
jgi:hypothetical protein